MEKLSQIQRDLKAPKGQRNNFGNYNYRSCEDILEAIKPLLDGGVITLSDEIEQIGERYYVKAIATFKYKGGVETVTAYAREEENKKGMDGAQVTGAASSYARKYALNGLFCIDDTKDADATNTHNKQEVAPTKVATVPASIAKAFPQAVIVPKTEAEFTKAIGLVTQESELNALYKDWKHFETSNTPAFNRLKKLHIAKREQLGA